MNQTKTIKFLHTADWHIRDVQYGRKFRGQDYRKAIRQIVDLAISNQVDFIINGGDTLNINRPSETMLDFLFEVHHLLKDAGIPMYAVTGNHDASEPSFLQFPERMRKERDLNLDLRFGTGGRAGIVCIDHQIIEHEGIRISGFPAIPFGPRPDEKGERLLDPEGHTLLEHLLHAEPVDICVWHGALDEFVPFPMRDSGTMDALPPAYAKAWLLGDIHLRARKRLENGALVSYPGPPEMCERGEPATKFVDYYSLEPTWREQPFPEPVELELQTRPVLFLSVADDAQADQAIQKIRQTITENPGQSPMIFARFAREQKPWVNRVHEMINPQDTVFHAASFGAVYRGPVAGLEADEQLPSLQQIADEVVPAGTPVNPLARKLVLPDMNIRHEIVTWVEDFLNQTPDEEAIV